MRFFVSIAMAIVFTILVAVASGKANTGIARPVNPKQWTPETRTWAVRSVIGEVGWGNPRKQFQVINEWVSVMGVYATRVKETGWPLEKIIRHYSSAIKYKSTHKRPWVLSLESSCEEPAGWPVTLKWSAHRPICEEAFLALDRWANGEIPTLTPTANHYGGPMDSCDWQRVETPDYYLNIFYNSNIRTRQPLPLKTFGRLEI